MLLLRHCRLNGLFVPFVPVPGRIPAPFRLSWASSERTSNRPIRALLPAAIPPMPSWPPPATACPIEKRLAGRVRQDQPKPAWVRLPALPEWARADHGAIGHLGWREKMAKILEAKRPRSHIHKGRKQLTTLARMRSTSACGPIQSLAWHNVLLPAKTYVCSARSNPVEAQDPWRLAVRIRRQRAMLDQR